MGIKIFKSIARAVTAVATGGISEVARAVVPSSRGILDVVEKTLTPTTLPQLFATGSAAFTGNPSLLLSSLPRTGENNMALNIGGLLGQVGQTFGGQPGAFGQLGTAAGLLSQFIPTQAPMTVASRGAIVPVVGRGLPVDVANAGLKLLNRLGVIATPTASGFTGALKRTISGIASLARRTPTGTIVSVLAGIGLSALEANLLTAWSSQRRHRRRMNPANIHALRKSVRRVESFHKLVRKIDIIRSPSVRRVPCAPRRKKVCR